MSLVEVMVVWQEFFQKLIKILRYTCFDTSYVNLLQYYYLKHNNLNVGFSKK